MYKVFPRNLYSTECHTCITLAVNNDYLNIFLIRYIDEMYGTHIYKAYSTGTIIYLRTWTYYDDVMVLFTHINTITKRGNT